MRLSRRDSWTGFQRSSIQCPAACARLTSVRQRPRHPSPGARRDQSYDPVTGDGVLVNEADLADVDLAEDALEGSLL